MKWLISQECQLNLINNLGDTPLHRVIIIFLLLMLLSIVLTLPSSLAQPSPPLPQTGGMAEPARCSRGKRKRERARERGVVREESEREEGEERRAEDEAREKKRRREGREGEERGEGGEEK